MHYSIQLYKNNRTVHDIISIQDIEKLYFFLSIWMLEDKFNSFKITNIYISPNV